MTTRDLNLPRYYYSNKLGRIILLAMDDVLGRNPVNALLRQAGLRHFINNYPPNTFDRQVSFDEISALLAGLDDLYGPLGAHRIGLRVGREAFTYGLSEFGRSLGVSDLSFRLLPTSMKLKVGAELFASVFNQFSDQQVDIEETGDMINWQITRCPMCWNRTSSTPCGALATGALQEALHWVSDGRTFHVEEVECVAQGASRGVFEIHRTPLD